MPVKKPSLSERSPRSVLRSDLKDGGAPLGLKRHWKTALPLKVAAQRKDLLLDVPLERGCAMVRIYREP